MKRFKLRFAAVKSYPNSEQTIDGQEIANVVRELGRAGDWILSRGIDFANNMVSTLTNMPLSHAVLFDKEQDVIIEADSNGVHTTDLTEFLSKMHRIMLIRPMWAGNGNNINAVENARALMGSGYNYTGLVGLGKSGRYYCTELAIEAYRPFILDMPDNPIPHVIKPGQMYHWGQIIFDTGPYIEE